MRISDWSSDVCSSDRLRNINRADNWGGRVALAWEPADTLSVKLAALLQKVDGDGTSQIDADSSLRPLAGYNQSNLVSTGPYSRQIQLYTSSIDLDLDFATLTSVTGYSLNDFRSIADANATFQGLRSEERRVGKEGGSTCRIRWS